MVSRFYYYILLAFLVFTISCSEREQKPFSFVQICDTQLGMGGYEHDLITFKQAVNKINELKPDFVVLCGDLVNDATDSSYSDFLKIKQGFNMPCYVASGNHDVGNIPNDTTLGYYRETIGKDYYEFHHKGYSFIVTNTQLWKHNIGEESEKHDKWFKETFKNHSIKRYPVFVIGHYPLYTEQPDEEVHYFNLPPNKRQEILTLFLQNNVIAYLSGHTHELTINYFEDIQLVSGETTSKNFDNRPFGFRFWEVTIDTVTQHHVKISQEIL